MNTKQSYNIISGPSGPSGRPGLVGVQGLQTIVPVLSRTIGIVGPSGKPGVVGQPGIPDKRWIRMIKIGKMLKLWEN
jgi:hypothetical protein